jgi:chromosome segregation ATPase
MADHADVSSIDALESFRADLIRFVEKARVALEDAEGQVRRTRTWLDTDRLNHWSREMKMRVKQLEQAEAEYYNARITRPTESHSYHKMAVAAARRRIVEAEDKLHAIKRWRSHYDNQVTPLLRQLDPAFFLVSLHLPKGIHALAESVKALQAYAEKGPAPKPVVDSGPMEGGAP